MCIRDRYSSLAPSNISPHLSRSESTFHEAEPEQLEPCLLPGEFRANGDQRESSQTTATPSLTEKNVSSRHTSSSVLLEPSLRQERPDYAREGSSRSIKKKNRSFRPSQRYPWLGEIISLVAAAGMLCAITAILLLYGGKCIPQLPISLNTLVSVLSTISTFLLMVPLVAAIGQCKWLYVQRSPRCLNDFFAIDDASKGHTGSVALLFRSRGG